MIKRKNERPFCSHIITCLSFLALALLLSGFLLFKTPARAAVISQNQRSSLIWFGDSRTVYFASAVYGYKPKRHTRPLTVYKKHVVAKSATTLGWARGTGYRKLCKRLKKRPTATVIMNFGVNDIGRGYDHKAGYLSLIRKIHKKYPRATLCFMSVNPVKASSRNPYARTGAKAARVNQRIASFNSYIHRNLPKGCIYINSSRNVSFSYKDGLHYTKAAYRRISKYVTGKRKLSK